MKRRDGGSARKQRDLFPACGLAFCVTWENQLTGMDADSRRTLPDGTQARRRRDGCGLCRARRPARTSRRNRDESVRRPQRRLLESACGGRRVPPPVSSHPNVCQLFEVGEAQGELFITMELLEGESLATRLMRGPIALGEVVPIAVAVLSALAAIHGSGIVHRDSSRPTCS